MTPVRPIFGAVFAVLAAIGTGGAARAEGAPASEPMTRTLLFVDDHDILYRSGTHRVFHSMRRHPGNPVIPSGETSWETRLAWTSIYRNPATGLYQIWYQSSNGARSLDRTRRCVVCYAESRDGIRFTKPDLGIFDYDGDAHNSIVLIANGGAHDRYGASVIVDDRDPNPDRRYKMSYYDFSKDDNGVERPGLCVAFSPDGVHWRKYPHAPLVRTAYAGSGVPVPFGSETGHEWLIPLTMSDAMDSMYDPKRGVFAIYGKMWIDGPDGGMSWKHGMGRIESGDFIHWSRPELVLTPDDDDPSFVEFHTAPVFFYNDCYFSLMQILDRAVGGGVIDIELALSRDGLDWSRPFRRQFALARRAPGAFDSGSIFTCATPVVLADEIRFYYGAYAGGATNSHQADFISGIGFATLPRDRFAGIRPDLKSDQPTLKTPLENIGQITLRPLRLTPGTVLTLNADCGSGAARVELLDELGYRLRGFTRDDAVPIRGDSLRHEVKWKGRSDGALSAGRYLIRIHLDNAEAFALNIEAAPVPH